MKKFFFILMMCFCFVACDNLKQEGKTANRSEDSSINTVDSAELVAPPTPITKDSAMQLIKKLRKMKLEDDSVSWTEYNVADLKNLFCSNANNITRVRFFVGALDTAVVVHNSRKPRMVPIIVMQIQRSRTSSSTEPSANDYFYYTGKTVCPPPEPCNKIEEEQ